MQTLHELFVHGLNDILDAEQQLVPALQALASDSSREDLKEAFESHRSETEGHVRRLQECFELLGEHPQNTECRGVRRLIDEQKTFQEKDPAEGVVDVFNLGAAIKSGTYEVREYESLIDMAREMRHTQVERLLAENLREERAALKKLAGFSKR
jgi:ferritin-like metal-binding protein YciE